jgi:hypothetical protein
LNQILDHALRYAKKGWSVIPLVAGTKRPSLASWQEFQTRLATTDEIRGWFADGNANIGVVTGAISGLVVVDLDGQEGMDEANKIGLRSNVVAVTGGGGRHLLFRHPGVPVKNAVRRYPGVDVRADAGYIVAPPSRHDSGNLYKWQGGFDGPLPPLPSALFDASGCGVGKGNPPGWIGETLTQLRPGYRDDPITRIVGRLHRDGWQPGDIYALLSIHPEVVAHGLDQLDRIVSSITAKPRGGPAAGGMTSVEKLLATPKVDWLLRGSIPRKTTTLIGGMPGVGKSWLLLDTALELTRPRANTVFGVGQGAQKVLYVDEENGENLLADRLRLLLPGKPDCDLASLKLAVDQHVSLSDPAGYTRFVSFVRDIKPDAIFVDSLVQIHNADENNAIAMTEVMNKLKAVRDEFGCTIFALHHEGKGVYAKEKENQEPTSGDLRGSNAISASVETVFTLRRREGLLSLYHTKARFAEALAPRILTLDSSAGHMRLRLEEEPHESVSGV